ncbi:MAG: hypothetical protein JZU65_08425 [Chlorobium sp.]|nr:hypothetical protein [Chlorobium sp.]
MKYSCHLLIGLLALLLCGCGTTVKESLKVQTATKRPIGADKTVVILPFADYSNADNLETAYRRNLMVSENLIDQFVSNSFHTPNNDDVFLFLVDQNIINVVAYENKMGKSIEAELQNDWSDRMKGILQHYIDQSQTNGKDSHLSNGPGTHGLTPQEIVKIGRHFSADYIVRGSIIQYKDRQDPNWSPTKRGLIPFVTGVTNKVAFGQAESEQYDTLGNMMAGGMYGATISAVSNGTSTENLVWGTTGAVLGLIAEHTGKIPQAVVQLRIWVQDAYTGNVVWTNRVDVKVSPESVLADYQYDTLFEKATEKAIATLVNDFTKTL